MGIAINAYRLQIFNASRATSVSSDGTTWGNSSQDLIPSAAILNGTWADYETYFRLPRDVDPLDAIYPRLCGYFGEVSEVCYDEMSIYGPVLKPGVATW